MGETPELLQPEPAFPIPLHLQFIINKILSLQYVTDFSVLISYAKGFIFVFQKSLFFRIRSDITHHFRCLCSGYGTFWQKLTKACAVKYSTACKS